MDYIWHLGSHRLSRQTIFSFCGAVAAATGPFACSPVESQNAAEAGGHAEAGEASGTRQTREGVSGNSQVAGKGQGGNAGGKAGEGGSGKGQSGLDGNGGPGAAGRAGRTDGSGGAKGGPDASVGPALGGSGNGGSAGKGDSGDTRRDAAADRDGSSDALTTPSKTVAEVVDVAKVWSRHPAAFGLVTRGNQQFLAFYDQERYLTVAQRTLGTTGNADGGTFQTIRLAPRVVECDSHNYVTLAVDADGYIHVSGNMHGVPLVYFRSQRPLDVTTLVSAIPMVPGGTNESEVTYPQFFFDEDSTLIFAYRDGSSGNGNYIFNRYDQKTLTWSRLLASPLIDGSKDDLSAYPVGPVRGPDGWFHLVWVWRESPNAETNKDLSYARSQDLKQWENADGTTLSLPITHASPGIIVDPVPTQGGMINNNTKIGFDAQNRVILSYHKNDTRGTQLYNARREGNGWAVHKTSSWEWTWAFSGGGTLEFAIKVEPVTLEANGELVQEWYNSHYNGWGTFLLDDQTLAAKATLAPLLPYPADLDTATTAGMQVQWAQDSGSPADGTIRYMLRWETLPSNKDQCPTATPEATQLRLYGIR